jgi:hypothetical protein
MKTIKNILVILLFTVISFAGRAQGKFLASNTDMNEMVYVIYTSDYAASRLKMEQHTSSRALTVIKQEETKYSHNYELSIKESQLKPLDSLLSKLGYVSTRELHSVNNAMKLEEKRLELAHLENKKKEYQAMLDKMDSVTFPGYYQHWEKVRAIDYEIFEAQRRVRQLEMVENLYRVRVTIHDEQSPPSSSKVSFVHMPGVQYSYFMTENPMPGISYGSYQGVSLKYMFTKGKDYFELGAYQANKPTGISDSLNNTAYEEIFDFSFGQDWYSKYFGRGTNKFMNLYIGYNASVLLASTSKATTILPAVSPGVGLELFKNKYMIIDTKVNYVLPFIENRYMRGWRCSGSFSFVF